MHEARIFVSCGQQNEPERALGEAIRSTVSGTPGFHAYFAQAVQDLQALGSHVFDALLECSGAVIVFHRRGEPTGPSHTYSSSMWVNQELAILAFRQHSEARRLPILCFKEEDVRLEGAMTALITNPQMFANASHVLPQVERWLADEHFHSGSTDAFLEKWRALSDKGRLAIAALVDEGGTSVARSALGRSLERLGLPSTEVHDVLLQAGSEFENTDLVKKTVGGTAWEYSLHQTWAHPLKRAIRLWLSMRQTVV